MKQSVNTVGVAQLGQQGVHDESCDEEDGRGEQEVRVDGQGQLVVLGALRLRRKALQSRMHRLK